MFKQYTECSLIFRSIQRQLQNFYRLGELPRVNNYIIQESKPMADGEGMSRSQVLIRQQSGEIELGIYFDPQILDRLEKNGSESVQLQDWLEITEEVSHFTYLVWKAKNQDQVSLLDLELQGEIDKYILLSQVTESDHEEILDILFRATRIRESLSTEEKSRYEEASALGEKFLVRLKEQEQSRGEDSFQKVLRNFYRKSSIRRLNLIHQNCEINWVS